MLRFNEEISKKMGHEKVKALGQYPFQRSLVTAWGDEGQLLHLFIQQTWGTGNFQSTGKRGLKLKQINTISRVAVCVLK